MTASRWPCSCQVARGQQLAIVERAFNVRFSNRPVWVKRFQTSIAAVSMSLRGSCFSSESAPGPFHHGIRERGGTISSYLPTDRRWRTCKALCGVPYRPISGNATRNRFALLKPQPLAQLSGVTVGRFLHAEPRPYRCRSCSSAQAHGRCLPHIHRSFIAPKALPSAWA